MSPGRQPAAVVAGMVSAAFVERDVHKLLDIGVGLIPEDSLIAQLHRDVRGWGSTASTRATISRGRWPTG